MDCFPPWNNGNGVVCGGGYAAAMGGEWWLQRREKWVKHYSSNHQILLVGEGDFSFSLSLALGFGSANNIIATSLDSYETLQRNYVRVNSNLEILRSLGATVLHGVDATKMKDHFQINYKKFDRIVFNFPHAGFYGKEDNPLMIDMHKDLLRGFFSNARSLLQQNGEIHLSHKDAPPYCDWNLEELARENSLHLMERVPFNIIDYPYYQNKRGHGLASDIPFNLGECSTFKFTASLSPSKFIFDQYPNHLISNNKMSSKLNTLIDRDPFIPNNTFNPHEYSNHLISNNKMSSELNTLINRDHFIPKDTFVPNDYSNHLISDNKMSSELNTLNNKDHFIPKDTFILNECSNHLISNSKLSSEVNTLINRDHFIRKDTFISNEYSNHLISNNKITSKLNTLINWDPLPPKESFVPNGCSNHLISNNKMSSELNTLINRDHFTPKDASASIYSCSQHLNHELETQRQLSYTQNSFKFNMSMRESLPLLKFIVKGSVRLYPRAAGYAGALMGSENIIMAIFSGPVDHFDSSVTELLAIRHALLMFERSNLHGKMALVVQSGSNDAVSWIKSDMGNPWEVQGLVKETRKALDRIGNADVCCNYREYGVETHQHTVDKWLELGYDMKSVTELWY